MMETLVNRLLTSRLFLRAVYYPWIALPYPARRLAVSAGIWVFLLMKRARGIHRRRGLTSADRMFTLSFWGVPSVNPSEYHLALDGSVQRSSTLGLGELKSLPAVERQVTLDCVGGLRNNCIMRGVSLEHLLDKAGPKEDARMVVFHCADGYFTTHPIKDLMDSQAFMAYTVNGLETPAYGFPLRLVAPGKYGYKWAKWVVRIELVPGVPKGYWEKRGVPDKAWVSDIR